LFINGINYAMRSSCYTKSPDNGLFISNGETYMKIYTIYGFFCKKPVETHGGASLRLVCMGVFVWPCGVVGGGKIWGWLATGDRGGWWQNIGGGWHIAVCRDARPCVSVFVLN
jgi:hypothetical protein